jgi:hypothetical protein
MVRSVFAEEPLIRRPEEVTPMKPDPDFDPKCRVKKWRRGYWPIRAIGSFMIAVALSGLMLRAWPILPRPSGPPAWKAAPRPAVPVVVQGPVQTPPAGVARPPDRFVIVAPAEIDPEMVVRARDDIDPKMVFNPESGRRGPTPIDPAPAVNPYFPVPVAAPAPGEPRLRR